MKRGLLILLASAPGLFAMSLPPSHPLPGGEKAAAPQPEIVLPTDPRPFVNKADEGGVTIENSEEGLLGSSTFTISFPDAVVTPDRIDAEGSESPLTVWPTLDTDFSWHTQSEGYLTIKGPMIPGQAYRFRLRDGMKDLSGNPLPTDKWGYEVSTPELTIVEEGYGERDALNVQPQIPLEFNYPIRLSDAAKGIWIQDRSSRKHYPVEVYLNHANGDVDNSAAVNVKDKGDDITEFRVRPVEPLPIGHRFDLVVDGVKDAYEGRGLSYPHVYPLGETQPLTIDYVAARNYPLEKPKVEVKFEQVLGEDALPKDALTFTPEVPNLRLTKDDRTITAEGDFDIGTKYSVVVSDRIMGASGYGLAAPGKWSATFRAKPGTLLFPNAQIRERSMLGLSFAFFQVNASALEWKLAPIPLDKLPEVLAREKEFTEVLTDDDNNIVWTREGWFKYVPSEPLISALNLAPIATGAFPADTSGSEVLRQVAWKPETPTKLEGPMLFEVTGHDLQGRVIGNRSVVYFGEAALTRKVTPDDTVIRVARQSDALPVAGVTVTALDNRMQELARGVTDPQGMVSWKTVTIPQCAYYLASGQGLATLQPVVLYEGSGAPSVTSQPSLRAFTFTDRPLYQPGQAVQFKGFVREEKDKVLQTPVGAAVKWSIVKEASEEAVAEGTTKVDDQGSWNGQWTPPADADLGNLLVKVLVNGQPAGSPATFQIEEYRNPPFSVICAVVDPKEPAKSTITVDSQYFHGAPNAGSRVKWTAAWSSDSSDGYYSGGDMNRVDLYSEHAPKPSYSADATGETALDANGKATLSCRAPFPDPGNRANCQVYWKVEVTGPDGQTITGGADEDVSMDKVLLGVSGTSDDGKLDFQWDAKEPFGTAPKAVDVQLFHVVTKSVKERLAPNVYRYRNFDQYIPTEQREGVTTEHIVFTPKEPGRYVAVLSPPKGTPGFPVSQDLFLEGTGESEVPVLSDSVIDVRSNREKMDLKNGRTQDPWKVGETANVTVLSPSGGIAWVSIETDKILDTFIAPIEGNTSKIEVPVKPEYEPNVYVTVYLLRPGGKDKLAGEMLGGTELQVVSPTRQLDLALKTDQPEYEPRAKIHGDISVTANGAPVADADLAVYAVDDSILTLGGWQLPSIAPSFFPKRSLAVTTSLALDAYVAQIQPSWLTMKGFVVGGGGDDDFSNTAFVRKQFKPIILWQPNVKTDAQGVATFDCEAPDNLTRFRVIAVGETKENQFGAGDTTFNVTKKLMIEPALPRYLREGDEVELRAVVRQKLSPEEKLTVRCTPGGSVQLTGDPTQEITAAQDAPVVVKFKAKAGEVGDGTVKFEVASASAGKTDAVQVALPVAFPVILKKEGVAGVLHGGPFSPNAVAPAAWKTGRGTFSLAISTTPWLAKLMGLPAILDYPHGCLEQKSSKLLGYTYLATLLDYLPEAGARRANYEHIIKDTLDLFEANLTTDGRLPYWPGQVTANDYVTIQSAWCVSQAQQAGLDVPESLASTLPETLTKMVTHHGGLDTIPTLRAFALFVLSTFNQDTPDGLAEASDDLFLQRDKLTGEGRAMLALAMHQLKFTPEKQTQLVSELPKTFDNIDFNAGTFSSAARTEALCTWARLVITPGQDDEALKKRLGELMESSSSLSTQENLWLLVAFEAYLKANAPAHLAPGSLKPKPDAVSANGSAVKWNQQDLARLADFVAAGLPAAGGGSFVLHADYRAADRSTELDSHGMKIERVVKNLTAPARDGTAGAPFKLGDQLLISYRFSSDHAQSYVAVEDMLPAGIEVVNPNLDLFGKYYSLPDGADQSSLGLSHSELREQQANLYFDEMPAGSSNYSILARATAAGTFIWPATQISPMYDSRFFGRSPSSTCIVSSE